MKISYTILDSGKDYEYIENSLFDLISDELDWYGNDQVNMILGISIWNSLQGTTSMELMHEIK